MDHIDSIKRNVGVSYVALSIGAIILIFGSVYLINLLSTIYGIGVGASVQSLADNTSLARSLTGIAIVSANLGDAVLESYIAFFVSLTLGAAAFVLLLSRKEVPTKHASKYTSMAAVLCIVYILIYALASSPIPSNFISQYAYLPYVGFVISILSIAYVEYIIRIKRPGMAATAKHKSVLALDPNRPFSNMLNLQAHLLSSMSGSLRIVDKHFNSSGLENLYRLIDGYEGQFKEIKILTSKSMLGAKFPSEVNDLKVELLKKGVALDVRLMDDKDATEQHERLLMDSRSAYKIPPINIINKKSEHIIKINFRDAERRFSELYGRSIIIDNYQVEKDRHT